MDEFLIVGNWKSNKTAAEAVLFLGNFYQKLQAFPLDNKKVVICPSFTALYSCNKYIAENNLPILLGAQNISEFEEGAFTGEVSSRQVAEFAKFVILGHSERRSHLLENDSQVAKKAEQAKKNGLEVILCVQDEGTPVPETVEYIAFEPISAIGTGRPDDPEHIKQVFSSLHATHPDKKLLYGGSVDENTAKNFLQIEYLGGFLVGGASLDPDSFFTLLSSC